MPPKVESGEKPLVAPKGYWQTPWQYYKAYKSTWDTFQKEDLDLKEFKKTKFISYFQQKPFVVTSTGYDRFFHSDDHQCEPIVKVKNIRDNIIVEEQNRIIPVVMSHIYGHRTTNLEGKTWISQKRINVMQEMYRRYNPNLKPTKKLPRTFKIENL